MAILDSIYVGVSCLLVLSIAFLILDDPFTPLAYISTIYPALMIIFSINEVSKQRGLIRIKRFVAVCYDLINKGFYIVYLVLLPTLKYDSGNKTLCLVLVILQMIFIACFTIIVKRLHNPCIVIFSNLVHIIYERSHHYSNTGHCPLLGSTFCSWQNWSVYVANMDHAGTLRYDLARCAHFLYQRLIF
jgi:hypothetical protein